MPDRASSQWKNKIAILTRCRTTIINGPHYPETGVFSKAAVESAQMQRERKISGESQAAVWIH